MQIEITRERLIELLITEETMLRLESGGVDNWCNYGDSLREGGDQSMHDFKKELQEATEEQLQGRVSAKKRLWLARYEDVVHLVNQAQEPVITGGTCPDREYDNTVKWFCAAGLRRITGISIPKGHVVPVESITITLAGASRKAKVAQ